jgi:7-cyano-7-deazaguanine synthase
MRSKAPALVLFSGGQDSTVVLADALDRFAHVETIGFTYGQRHVVELAARHAIRDAIPKLFPKWGQRLGADHMIDISSFGQISDTALTRDTEIEAPAGKLPNTFVPGRNLLFFTYAAAIAYGRGISTLAGGMCETDFSGYPDCRDETLQSLAKSLSLGMDRDFRIETPLMWLDKAQIWALGDKLGGSKLTSLIVEASHTCYQGVRGNRFIWGHGCGTCPACELRKRGFETWQAGKR